MSQNDKSQPHDVRCAHELRLLLLTRSDEPTHPSTRMLQDIAVQISEHCGHGMLKAHRLAWGYTVQEAVDAVHALCAEHGLGARGLVVRLWARWEAGEHPSADYQDLLCRLFRTRPDRLGFAADYTETPVCVPAVPARHRLEDQLAVSKAVVGTCGDRAVHTGLVAGTAGCPADQDFGYGNNLERIMSMAADGSAQFGDHPSNVGPLTLDQLRSDARDLARSLVNAPQLVVFDKALRLRDRLFTLISGRQRMAERRELYFLAAASLGMLAETTQNLGYRSQAMTHARTGLICAEEAGHPDLTAWLRRTQSLIAYWDGRLGQAVDYAQRGQEAGPKGTAAVSLAALEARAAAQRHDVATARAAMQRARTAREQVEVDVLDTDYGGILSFSPVKQSYYASGTWVSLGDGPEARRAGEDAVRAYQQGPPEERAYDNEAIAQVNIATAYVLDGELDAAQEAAGRAMSIPAELRIDPVNVAVRRLYDHASRSEHRDSTPALELRDQIEDFLALPGPTLPGA